NRQSPATLPSVRPQLPLCKVLAAVRACVHLTKLKQLAFFSQINPVSSSSTVPLPLSLKRTMGNGTPIWISPSCPVPAQVRGVPVVSQHCVCPVCATGAFWAWAGDTQPPTHVAIMAAISTTPSFGMSFCIAQLLSGEYGLCKQIEGEHLSYVPVDPDPSK